LPPAQRAPRPARLDVVGPALFIATLFSLVLAVSRGGAWGWTSREVLLAGSLSAVALALFLRAEVRDAAPFFDLRLFRNRLFSAATASALMNYMASSTTAFLTPFLLIRGMGLPANRAGMVLMATPFVMAVIAPVSGRLSDRIGSRLLTVSGMACLGLGMGLLSRVGPGAAGQDVLLRLALVGLGVGLFTSPNNNAIMGAVPQGEQGLASGLVATARSLGMVLGVSVSGALFGGELQRLLAGGAAEPAAVATAYGHALTVGAGIAVLGALTSLVRGEFTKT
jgi:MFS family permease